MAKRAVSTTVECGFDSRHPYQDGTIKKVYGPYARRYGGRGKYRRQVVIERTDGSYTSMTYARWLMAAHLGRRLDRSEHVHHLNDDPLDDRVENYEVISSGDHARAHAKMRAEARAS